MFKVKRIAGVLASAAMAMTLLSAAGCSTPQNAMTVGDTTYTTGEYLAYLYNSYYQVYSRYNFALYAQYNMDPWAQELTYGEGDNEQKLKADEYIVRSAQDAMTRQVALKHKMKEYGIDSLREKDLENVESDLKSVKNDDTIRLGFKKDTYVKMYTDFYCNEMALFYGLYDTGGQRAVTEADIRTYFDDNYRSYKMIELTLAGTDGADLSEEETKKVLERLDGYLTLYQENKDFDKVIDRYNQDEADAKATEEKPAETVTPSTDKDNRRELDVKLYGDEDFTNALNTVAVDEAKVVQYKKSGTTNTAALILRLDPEKGEEREDYFTENRDNIIYGLRYEEFSKEIKDYIATLDVEVNKTVEKKCRPQNFVTEG
ncbi:MAG: hypothetical protein HFJ80_07440 [Clostridiales bacterium]|nr:hypothetical protein [Clostridiales bacterium]